MNYRTRQSGFTLLELMVALAVAGILFAIAVPNLRTFIQNNRLTAASNDLLASLQLARTEAVKRQANVVVCATTDSTAANPTCSFGGGNAWIVFQDTNRNWQADGAPGEPVIERHVALDPSISIRGDGNAIVAYGPSGYALPAGPQVPTADVVFCDVRGVQASGLNSTARTVVIAPTGHARAFSSATDVNASMALIGGTCP